MIQGLYDIFKHWHTTGTVWVYSDTHFNDKELGEGVAARPSTEEHLKLINSKVGKKDTLILQDYPLCPRNNGRRGFLYVSYLHFWAAVLLYLSFYFVRSA